MNRKELVKLIYGCHSLPQGRKDALFEHVIEVAERSSPANWQDLLRQALAVRDEFFMACVPSHQREILEDLAGVVRRFSKAGRVEAAYGILDDVYCPGEAPPAGGEAVAFLRTRLENCRERRTKAMYAAVILELPFDEHRVEDAATAAQGESLFVIRALERLCAFGEEGFRQLVEVLEEIQLTPATAYTLLDVIDTTGSGHPLASKAAAAVLRRIRREERELGGEAGWLSWHALAEPPRISQVLEARRSLCGATLDLGKRVSLRTDPVFRRFAAARANKRRGNHVGQENDTDAALPRGSPAHPGGPGGERIRLSAKLKCSGIPPKL